MTLEKDFERYMRRVLDSGHQSRPGADAAPVGTWQHVLAKVQPQDEENDDMSASTLTPDVSRTPGVHLRVPTTTSPNRRGFGHYLNLAATIAVVFAVAVAGWFATMQLNAPSEQEPRLAIVESTPISDSAMSCDVEPLTQERVLEIVKNPIPFIENSPAGEPVHISVVLPTSADLYEMDVPLAPVQNQEVPTREQFVEADDFANEYLECLLVGTQGQVWNFYSPVNIQSTILAEFPVFANEEDVNARIAERLHAPAIEGEWLWQDLSMLDHVADVEVNPDRNQATVSDSQSLFYDQIMTFGIVLRDADGKAMVLTDSTGRNTITSDPAITGLDEVFLNITLVRVRDSDTWLVIPASSLAETGNFPAD